MAGDPEQRSGDTPSPLPTESTNTLTREHSLTPQWLQTKPSSGGLAISSLPNSGRGRQSNDTDKPLDSSRRSRSESLGGNEAVRPRPSKWAPDDRESWKPKERWATGPDSSKRWLEVQTTGRQKQGWGTNELSRSQGDRWNTEGGRWTEDRKPIDDKEYVPKNSRWNDEERAQRWQMGGRGDSNSRGRAQARGQGSRRAQSDVQFLTDANGIDFPDRKLESRRIRYSKKDLLAVYDQLQKKMGATLILPKGVDISFQGLFRTDRELVIEEKVAVKREEVALNIPKPPNKVNGIGPEELEADSWVYKDPLGQVQGPFSKQEVLAWWEEGYFPSNLQVQSQLSAKENWVPLEKLLQLWNVPVDKRGAEETITHSASFNPNKLEACDSLATVGSHISSLMPEIQAEIEKEHSTSQAPEASPIMSSQQPQPFQNPVSDLHQTMQNLMAQRQKQTQQQAAVGGMNLGNSGLGNTGFPGLRPGLSFQQSHPFMGNAYGIQQQRPSGIQDNQLLTPAMREALQQRISAQQQLSNRGLQSNPFGFSMNTGLNPQMQNPLPQNMALAALLNQNQMAQRHFDPRNTTEADLQRLMQSRGVQAQGGQFSMNSSLSGGSFGGGGMHPSFLQQQQQQQQQNPWLNQSGGQYNALNALLQQRAQQQQFNQQQQQLNQALLLSKLQGLRFQGQLGMNPMLQNRELLSLAALQGGDPSLVDGLNQQRQRNNMSPQNAVSQSTLDNQNFALLGQSNTPASFPQFNYPNQKPAPFPHHILQHPTSKPDATLSSDFSSSQPSNPSMLSLDPSSNVQTNESKTSLSFELPSKTNAWGTPPAPPATASLVEIQEEESRRAQQNAVKEKQVQASTMGHLSGMSWNVQHTKPMSLAEIMQEDESRRQAEAAEHAKQSPHPSSIAKQGNVWAKRPQGRGNVQDESNEKGDSLLSKEGPDGEGGFWNLDSNGPVGDSPDLNFSHDVESEVQLFSGHLKISQQFREWCRANMIELGGSGDIALIEFLVSLESRSEIAEYIEDNFKHAPQDKVSVFITEFLKRKDGDPAQIKKESGSHKSKKKTKTKDPKSINSVELEAVSSGASESHGLETGTSKALRARDGKSKPKAKKQAKGQHIPADMLGFKSNVNFDSLYRGNSNG